MYDLLAKKRFLNQDLISKAILEFLKLHSNQCSYIFADPDRINIVVVKCYEKSGFKTMSEAKDTDKELWTLWESPNSKKWA